MSFLDKVGKVAMDGLEKATRAADKVQERMEPLIERSAIATKVRDRISPKIESEEPPDPFANDSPFIVNEPVKDEEPLGDVEIPAQVFGSGTDPWTGRSVQLLKDYGAEHVFTDLDAEDGLKIETRLVRETGQDKPPFIFLRGELIGGYNALNEIVRLGQLDEMVKHPDERAKGGGLRIVIAKREGGDETPPGER